MPAHHAAFTHEGMDQATDSLADVHTWTASKVRHYYAFVQQFWQGCRTVCLMTGSARSCLPHDVEGTALQDSASKKWGYVIQ